MEQIDDSEVEVTLCVDMARTLRLAASMWPNGITHARLLEMAQHLDSVIARKPDADFLDLINLLQFGMSIGQFDKR